MKYLWTVKEKVSKERKGWEKASQPRLKTQVQLFPLKIYCRKHASSDEGGLDGKLLLSKGKGNPHLDPSYCHAQA